jgi:cobalt-zinc-cadmium efflux system membrane fusion protein
MWMVAQLPTAVILVLLAGLAYWGARNDWKLPRLGSKTASPDEDPKAESVRVIPTLDPTPGKPASPVARQARIEFPSPDTIRATGIEVATVGTRPMSQVVTANGMLDYEPYHYTQLAARAPGTVWLAEKSMGEPVRKGEVLALIESADVGRAKADFLQSLAQVDVRTAALQRLHSAGGAVSGGNVQEIEAAVREARIRLFNDHQRLLNLGLSVRLEDIVKLPEEQQVRYLRLLGLPETVRKQFDPDTLTANLLPLTAPFDGRVIRHPHAAPGMVVATNQPLFAVGDTSHLHIELEVDLQDVSLLRPGQLVTFVPEMKTGETAQTQEEEAPKPATGTLAHISPEVNEKTHRVPVHAEVENPDGRLRPNTYGTGRIVIRDNPQAVTVPAEALQWEVQPQGRFYFVFVQMSETSFQVRPVKPGLRDRYYVELDGVSPGERVVTTGSHVLKSELLKERIGGAE